MDTLRYDETKKSSKGPIIGLLLFFIIGGAILYIALANESKPVIIGNQPTEEVNSFIDIYDEPSNTMNLEDISYSVNDKKYSDKTNSKIKSNITLPVISINGEELTELNEKIDKKYTELFAEMKTQMATVESKYTYKVTYSIYENEIGDTRVVSVTIYHRTIDDATGAYASENIDTYNIDVKTKLELTQSEVATMMFGISYKTKLKNSVKDYFVSNNIIPEDEYTYAITGFENFYVKEGKFHIIFNGEIIKDKYFDVTI